MVEVNALYNFDKLKNLANDKKADSDKVKEDDKIYKIVLDSLINKESKSETEKPNKEVAKIETTTIPARVTRPKIKEMSWSEVEVENWLNEKRIHPNIEHHLKPCDGSLLYEFYLIKKEAPDFFYRSLAINKNNFKPVLIRDVAVFSLELKKIFSYS